MRASDVKILVVDDEESIVRFLELGLRNEGFQVWTAPDGLTAVSLAREVQPHVVILDVMMPGPDGFEVVQMLRKLGSFAIIMLTAKDEVEDRVKGLNLGADDYVVKPFSFQELLARIHARLRNQFPQLVDEWVVGPFTIHEQRREITYQGQPLSLSATEYELLRYLLINHGIVLSKQKILDAVWGYDFGGQDNIVEVYIRSLREKLGDTDRQLIRTIRGAGYRVDLP
ncbi:MAG: response regulator transcription factor [Thermoflavifilum sp.]|nr:response regulator transcription factor [Thermoflavifilum sp.]MCL6514062.1 response regulator transcription factor [Alicyclobacillus sp.]